ncbi:MAG: class I SAM-dependent methyltransferase [Thermomicrobiales bacterium]
MSLSRNRYEDQKDHFDLAKNQYPTDTILKPPMHTRLELDGVMSKLVNLPPGRMVMDFGAGTGRLSIALANAGYPVLAVDLSEISLRKLQDVARELDLQTIETSTEFPAEGDFAAVVGSDVLHHVELDDFLPKFMAVLADGGKIVFSEPGGMNPVWYAYLSIFYDMKVERRIVHCNLLTLRRKLERYGFRDVKITGVGLLPRPLFGWSRTACRLHDRLGNLPMLRWFAYRYLIEAAATK